MRRSIVIVSTVLLIILVIGLSPLPHEDKPQGAAAEMIDLKVNAFGEAIDIQGIYNNGNYDTRTFIKLVGEKSYLVSQELYRYNGNYVASQKVFGITEKGMENVLYLKDVFSLEHGVRNHHYQVNGKMLKDNITIPDRPTISQLDNWGNNCEEAWAKCIAVFALHLEKYGLGGTLTGDGIPDMDYEGDGILFSLSTPGR